MTLVLCRLALACALLLVAPGCNGRMLATEAPAKGNLLSLTAKHGDRAGRRTKKQSGPPTVLLIERDGVRAVDPVTASELWSHRAVVAGHPAASATTVFVPLHGHRLLAIDRVDGATLWTAPMPGEALTGMAASGSVVVLSVIDRKRGRSRVVGLSATDGQIRWIRRSNDRFGAPAAVGGVAVVPLGTAVIGLRLRTGREVARLAVPAPEGPRAEGAPSLERVEVQGRNLVAGQGTSWVDLGAALGAKVSDLDGIDPRFGDIFPDDEGLDPGFGDRERLRMWVDFRETAAGPRSAMLMCRRGVLAFRIDAHGRPIEGRWAYLNRDDREFVAMHVTDDRVTLVLEDGEVLTLGRRNGAELDRIAGGQATTGALFLDVTTGFGEPSRTRPTKKQRLNMLAELVLDPDARLLPAQLLVADLLWLDDEPRVRDAVAQLASAQARPESTSAAAALRKHALDLVSSPWGRRGEDEAASMLADLAARPSFLDDVKPPIGMLARAAVAAGDGDMVPHLVGHLLHPATASADLAELVLALDKLGRPDAARGIAAFVRRYHTDALAVDGSEALLLGVSALLRRATATDASEADARASLVAREALTELLDDPFTEAELRGLIEPNFPAELRVGPELVDDDPSPPMLADAQ